jgi:hypothetical protein
MGSQLEEAGALAAWASADRQMHVINLYDMQWLLAMILGMKDERWS